jgi:hypothetical protein
MSNHAKISYMKSALRIGGYLLLPFNIIQAAIVLVLSEIVGIVEEIGH